MLELAERLPALSFAIAEYNPQRRLLNDIMRELPDRRGLGTFFWEPTQSGAWGQRRRALHRDLHMIGLCHTSKAEQLRHLARGANFPPSVQSWCAAVVVSSTGERCTVQMRAPSGERASVGSHMPMGPGSWAIRTLSPSGGIGTAASGATRLR